MVRTLYCILFFAIAGYGSDGRTPRLRLSEVQDIVPLEYAADLTLDPAKDGFKASIDIKIQMARPSRMIWLNAGRLQIQNASLAAGSQKMSAKTVRSDDDFVRLEFDRDVPAGFARISIEYSGGIRQEDMSAVFHLEDKGNHYIFTQFESTDARNAFPCFDEPAYKTPWQLTVRVPVDDVAVSNTPVLSEAKEAGLKKYVFQKTKPLPSYLVAFGVGPFEFVDAGVAGRYRFPVRIITPKGRAGEARYAAEVTADILTRLEDYFAIPYPFEKSDQLSVPATAGFGAMENAGLVTYAQNMILSDPASDTLSRQRHYAVTAAHELAHQWFGDLVTMEWWDDIWLNESFATWMEQKVIGQWKPEWNTAMDDTNSKLLAQEKDSVAATRKIRQPIEAKGDIDSAFDEITYEKGAAVLGMYENWMGREAFREGVQRYLHRHEYGSATSADFLDALDQGGKAKVSASFSTFLNQAGVPVVSVSLDCSQDTPKLRLEQTRFAPLGSKTEPAESWSIPVCIRYGTGTSSASECRLMTQPTFDWILKNVSGCPSWVEANDRAKGYYHADYRGGLVSALAEGDVNRRLTPAERVDLVGNAYAMSKAGKLPAADTLALVERLHADSEREVVERTLDVALGLQRHEVAPEMVPNYRRFLLKNFQRRARELGWIPRPGESDDERLLRLTLVGAVATIADDRELSGQARELTDRWLQHRENIDLDVLGAVLDTAAYFGDRTLFDRFLQEFKRTQNRQVKQKLLDAMISFRDSTAIEAGMQAVLSRQISLSEGYALLIRPGQDRPETQKLPFMFVKAHFAEIMKNQPTVFGIDLLNSLPYTGSSFCDANSRDELLGFFGPKTKGHAGGMRTLNQVIEGINQCIAVTSAQNASVVDFLKKY